MRPLTAITPYPHKLRHQQGPAAQATAQHQALPVQAQADATYASEAERVRAFIAQGGGSRSTYFNLARQQRVRVAAPAIRLHHPPPKRPVGEGDSQWIWRPWRGRLEEN